MYKVYTVLPAYLYKKTCLVTDMLFDNNAHYTLASIYVYNINTIHYSITKDEKSIYVHSNIGMKSSTFQKGVLKKVQIPQGWKEKAM